MTLPNFIIFGAPKCGSTSLCNYLNQHPEIYISKKKEPNFFLYDQNEINESTGEVNSLEYYEHFFAKNPQKVQNEKALGEASISYLSNEKSPHRIHHKIPDVKLIAILRNPIDRLYSQYLFYRRIDAELKQTFQEALIADQKGEYSKSYLNDGFYGKYLPPYFELFPADNIKIILFEDFVTDTVKVLQEIYRFLDVNDNFTADVAAKDAVSGIPRSRKLYNFVHQPNPLKTVIKSVIKPFIPDIKRRLLWTKAVETTLKKPQMTLGDRQKLLEIYRDDILSLQKLINRDLSAWLKID